MMQTLINVGMLSLVISDFKDRLTYTADPEGHNQNTCQRGTGIETAYIATKKVE